MMQENQKKSANSEGESQEHVMRDGKPGRKPGGFLFPRHSLKKSIELANAIWTQNGGNPFTMLDLAPAIGMSPASSAFVTILASSLRYGLTEGSPRTKIISLTAQGRSIVAPNADTDVNAALRRALNTPEIFKQVFDRFDNKPLPRQEVLRNTLLNPRESGGFGVPREDVEEFLRVFNQNITDYGLIQDIKGNPYLRLDKLSTTLVVVDNDTELTPAIKQPESTTNIQEPVSMPTAEKQVPKQIFVAHGKNKKPLEQLAKILTKYNIPHVIATDEPHKGRPIGTKVADEMKRCTAGIFIFTGDEETKNSDGETVMRPSDNVVYELGAGSVLYGNKIIILREEDVEFASDFTEFGRISFEKNKLDAHGLEIFSELAGLEIIKFSVT